MHRISQRATVVPPTTSVAMASDAKPAAKPAAAKPAKKKSYKVRSGETLTAISRKFSCDTRALAEANKIKAPRYAIRPGQTLQLEGCTAE